MGSAKTAWLVWLNEGQALDATVVGGKAASLAKLNSVGASVPSGFCLTVIAYQQFLIHSNLSSFIQMELGRKSLASMRWEEIWDAALRIRSAFLRATLPPELVKEIKTALMQINHRRLLAVRSSALGEDSAQGSFAGLHESLLNIQGEQALLQAVRIVWASLWSDAALLYRKELCLDPLKSSMAVIVQEIVQAQTSGVAFGRDPRNQAWDREIVEAVPGPCSNLVDGLLEPDRWILERSSGLVIDWAPGKRDSEQSEGPLLTKLDLRLLHTKLGEVEAVFGWPPDIEWVQRNRKLSLLQARPITSGLEKDERGWYLTLRLKLPQLRLLAEEVSKTLLPELQSLGQQLAEETIEESSDEDLAKRIEKRLALLLSWRDMYKEKFIPLAHGVRYFGAYYNDALQPQDPYEFMMLLVGQNFLASDRNAALLNLAHQVHTNPALFKTIAESVSNFSHTSTETWAHLKKEMAAIQGGPDFINDFEQFLRTFMDTSYNGTRLADRPDALLSLIHRMGPGDNKDGAQSRQKVGGKAANLEEQLIKAVGKSREQEAREIIAIGRLSWRLRDDDNILLGRIESQFLKALHLGARRLREAGRLTGVVPNETSAAGVVQTLRDRSHAPLHLEKEEAHEILPSASSSERPRQMIGQPASTGFAEGAACLVNRIEDFQKFQRGDILVCDSIQPTMTHLVPLASAIVERRGGMLIHGAIIARELGIPCVNGIPLATSVISDGDQLTVDGYLGMVTIGSPDFDLENRALSLVCSDSTQAGQLRGTCSG